MSDNLQHPERELHELFTVLREHVVEVMEDFEETLGLRLQGLSERPPEVAPSARAVATQLGVQMLNLIAGFFQPFNDENDHEL